MKSADAIINALLEENVKVIFGIPGFPIIPLYDVFSHNREIRHVLARHEQAASFMAYAYGMVTGKPGTCLVIDGPGATNISTGIADAHAGSIPLVALIGKIPGSHSAKGAVHELDAAFFKPITKEIFRITAPDKIASTIHEAYTTASTGRKGPVCVEIPMDLFTMEAPPEKVDGKTRGQADVNRTIASESKSASELLSRARKPLMLAGGGVLAAEASQELIELAEYLGMPVAVSHMGRGSIPDDHPLALGLLRNNPTLIDIVQDSDVVIAAGFKFSQILTFNWTLKIPRALIQIDINPRQLGRNYPVEVGIAGDAKTELRNIIGCLQQGSTKKGIEDYPRLNEISAWKELITMRTVPDSVPIKPLRVIQGLRNCLARDALVATDVGNAFFWMLFFLEMYHPRTLICSSSFSAMGCGLPFAIGAKLAEPGRQVVCVTGDGGFLMNNQELATAVENNLTLPIVILNDSGYGAIRHIQERACGGRYVASNWKSPDLVQIAKGFGADGTLITKPQDIEPSLRAALAANKPAILDIRVDGEEKLPRNRLPSET